MQHSLDIVRLVVHRRVCFEYVCLLIRPKACTPLQKCSSNGGQCFNKNSNFQCNATVYHEGCSELYCGCCIPNVTVCIEKPQCDAAHGMCMKPTAWSTCNGAIDSSACYGTNCACCKPGACTPKPICSINEGYCFDTTSNHTSCGNCLCRWV
ncbi:EGF-like domain-containing protein comC [Macrobrachium nipponense]|uniref:EGF-like domain-containing protein comC n=1 Tax=Macrobrachium nipponense TaxID=159736 RepID=UPI0030C8D19E